MKSYLTDTHRSLQRGAHTLRLNGGSCNESQEPFKSPPDSDLVNGYGPRLHGYVRSAGWRGLSDAGALRSPHEHAHQLLVLPKVASSSAGEHRGIASTGMAPTYLMATEHDRAEHKLKTMQILEQTVGS